MIPKEPRYCPKCGKKFVCRIISGGSAAKKIIVEYHHLKGKMCRVLSSWEKEGY